MMVKLVKDKDKTKEQLTDELVELRQQIAGLEASEAERQRVEEAYSRHYRSKYGNQIARSKWSDIFHNRFYLGEAWLKKGDVSIKGTHKPLVDENTFTQVQQVLRQHDKNKQRTKGINIYCAD